MFASVFYFFYSCLSFRAFIFPFTLLTGTIPDAIANLQSLSEMDLSGNQLSGSLPDSIGELKALTKLSLQQNDFFGTHCCRLGFVVCYLFFLKPIDLNIFCHHIAITFFLHATYQAIKHSFVQASFRTVFADWRCSQTWTSPIAASPVSVYSSSFRPNLWFNRCDSPTYSKPSSCFILICCFYSFCLYRSLASSHWSHAGLGESAVI